MTILIVVAVVQAVALILAYIRLRGGLRDQWRVSVALDDRIDRVVKRHDWEISFLDRELAKLKEVKE